MKLYRIEDNWGGYDPTYKVIEFPVTRETDKCYVIHKRNYYGISNPTKYVLKDGKNLYAWDTLEKAEYNYMKRKEFQQELYISKLKATETRYSAISIVVKGKNKA